METNQARIADFLKASYSSMDNPRKAIRYFSSLIWVSCHMNSWCYNTIDKKLVNFISEFPEENKYFLEKENLLDYIKEHNNQLDPFLLSNSLGMLWIAELDRSELQEGESPALVYILGPVFASGASPELAFEQLRKMNFTVEERSRMENILHDIPVIPEGTMEQYAKMLHFVLTGQTTDQTPFHFFKQEVKAEKFFDESKVTYEDLRGDGVPLSRVTMVEEELLSFIRNGQFDRRRISTLKDNIIPAKYTDDVVLNAKYTFVAFASKAASAAVEGGLPVRISKTLELQLVRLLSHCRKMTDIKDLSTMMMIEYTSRVRHCKGNPKLSEVVVLIQDYIQNNLTNSISLSDLSKQFGYTEYYLSRRFNQETGQRISDYLNHERIEYSKNLLLNTDLAIQEISQVLQYENFSYFGQLFKKQVGQTPQEYRSSPSQKFKETYPFETKNLN